MDYAADDPRNMRYYVEVTHEEAQRMEDEGYATVALGASGGGERPWLHGRNVSWMLFKTPALREQQKLERD